MKKAGIVTLIAIVLTLITIKLTAQTVPATKINVRSTMQPTEEAVKNLKPYPVKLDSLERYVIYLEEKENEDEYQVEIIAGRHLEMDCNNQRLLGQFEEETVKGWGYTYHVFETEGHITSTLMMCPGPKTMKFIAAPSEMVRYNSRLPIVVYLPKDYELKYKIWSAGEALLGEKR